MTFLEKVLSQQFCRDELVDILSRYNRSIGNDDIAQKNILRLQESSSVCVFTGQQLGFMGGPAYTLYKAIGCLQAAKELDAIPIFWLATEDHDIAEIDHTYTIDSLGNIQKHKLTLPSEGIVEDLVLTQENIDEIQAFCDLIGMTVPQGKYAVGDSYARVMANILVEKFHGTGLVFVEPRLIRHQAEELFIREIQNSRKVRDILFQTTERLLQQGQVTPIEFRDGATNLFFKDSNNRRLKVVQDEGEFVVGDQRFSESELVDQVRQDPSAFSGNVALRPVVQNFIFPTIAYVGGPTEIDYFRQLEGLFHYHNLAMPQVKTRPSVTCLTPISQQYLNAVERRPSDAIPQDWKVVFPELAGMDKKEVKNFLEEKGVPYNTLHYLHNFLSPFNGLQERSLNWLWLDVQSEKPIVQELLNSNLSKVTTSQYFTLNELAT